LSSISTARSEIGSSPGRGICARSLPGKPDSEWPLLVDHLRTTGRLAAEFAAAFGAADLAYLCGVWHDLGKFAPEWQRYLRVGRLKRKKPDHSTAGALLAKDKRLDVVAYVVAAHHSGLADIDNLRNRLTAKANLLQAALAGRPPQSITDSSEVKPPAWVSSVIEREFLIRMLFSCLVDADRLEAELHQPGDRRLQPAQPLTDLLSKLERHISSVATGSKSPVNDLRSAVLANCRKMADSPTGAFSLTVPTGGGKTLSAMDFALRHAIEHNLDRVIVAIPFTSITEQTANVYRHIFGADSVVEHHSAIDPVDDTPANRRASENWDAPIIVTTNVQLFESIFANKTSRARKIHSVAKSVLILDEAQTLPSAFLDPILSCLHELTEHYRTSVVFSTATQPALSGRTFEKSKSLVAQEIVENPLALFQQVNRVAVSVPTDLETPTSWSALAARLKGERQALIVTHQKEDARELASRIPESLHLSASMCAAHRSVVLEEAKNRLSNGAPCVLVSTQVVEAGVDIDFPFVMRALGPLDSMAQAAGRCNREGRLKDATGASIQGRFEVFIAPSPPPPGTRDAVSVTKTVLSLSKSGFSLIDPEIFLDYFKRLYYNCETDEKGIQIQREESNFEQVARDFRLIDEGQCAIIVPYSDAADHVKHLEASFVAERAERHAQRALQRFIVNVSRSKYEHLEETGSLRIVSDTVAVLSPSDHAEYDPRFGLIVRPTEPPRK